MKGNVLVSVLITLAICSQILFCILYINNLTILFIAILINISIIIFTIKLLIKYNILKIQVSKDSLTEIYNRQYFMNTLEKEIERSTRNNTCLAMVLFDIDDFKKVNDGYGHYIGDQVLTTITKSVSNIIRKYDTFGRLGGEEFGIILPELREADTIDLCERIRHNVEELDFETITVTISIGVAMFCKGDNQHSLYQKSDDAMYRAKNCGKNKVILFQ